MSKTSTTKRALNRNHNSNSRGANQTHSRQAAAAEAKTRVSLRNTSSGRPLGKKTRKKRSRQQAAEVRDTLNAEFRDLRTKTMDTVQQSRGLQLPDSTTFTPPQPKAMSEAAGFDPLAQQLSEQSVQDLASILSTL